MIIHIKYFIVFIFLFILNFDLNAQSSPRVSIQGTLKDANGAATADGTYTVTFNLYNVSTGGTPLWSEEAPVEVAGGIYSHYLGSVNPLNSSNFNSTLFLGVKVGAYELSPRTELTYAPYAFAVLESVCSGAVGDVKYSILNPTEFATVNGPCWVPMDGRAIDGSALKNLSGLDNVPDGGGAFLRAQEFAGGANNDPDRTSNSPIATIQNHELFSHSHGVNDPGHAHALDDIRHGNRGRVCGCAGQGEAASKATETTTHDTFGASTGISIASSGGTETRPVNMNFWIYIRIN